MKKLEFMKERFRNLFGDKACRTLLILTAGGILGQVLFLSVAFRELPPKMPLFYSLHWGEGQLAPTFNLFLIPFLTALFLLINAALSLFVFAADLFWKRILSFTSLVLGMLTTYWIYKTVTIFI